jgi:hypothetical protein
MIHQADFALVDWVVQELFWENDGAEGAFDWQISNARTTSDRLLAKIAKDTGNTVTSVPGM